MYLIGSSYWILMWYSNSRLRVIYFCAINFPTIFFCNKFIHICKKYYFIRHKFCNLRTHFFSPLASCGFSGCFASKMPIDKYFEISEAVSEHVLSWKICLFKNLKLTHIISELMNWKIFAGTWLFISPKHAFKFGSLAKNMNEEQHWQAIWTGSATINNIMIILEISSYFSSCSLKQKWFLLLYIFFV